MALQEFTENVAVIQGLSDLPNLEGGMTAQELKEKFDEASTKIKAYLNEQVVPAYGEQREALQTLALSNNEAHTKIRALQDADAATAEQLAAIQEHDTRQDEALQDLNEKVTGLIDDSSRAADKTLSSQFIYEMFSYTDQVHQTWLKTRVDDNDTSADKTWSSQKLDGMFTEHNGAINELFTRVDGVVNDECLSGGSTWSSNKLYGMFGEVESALDAILAMQNALIGGESA